MSHCGQGLNHQPNWVIGIFYCQLTIRFIFQGRQIYRLCPRFRLCKRYSYSDTLPIRKYWQIVLLTITKALATNHDLGHQQTIRSATTVISEGYRTSAISRHLNILLLSRHHLHGLWIKQFQTSFTDDSLLSSIQNTSRDSGHVTLAHKTRHIRYNHDFFPSYSIISQYSGFHILCMSQTHEVPSGQALWQSEFHRHPSFAISQQLRIEECCLLQILSHLHLFNSILLVRHVHPNKIIRYRFLRF